MNNIEKCLLCNGEAILKTKEQKGYQAPTLFSIYNCQSCNTSFSLPQVGSTDIYQFIYEQGDQVSGYNRYWKYYNQIKEKENPLKFLENAEPNYWSISELLKKNFATPKEANILEIGSGLGYFIYSLRKEGFTKAYGMEIAAEAVDRAKKQFGDFYIQADLFQYAIEKPNSYDAIYMSEVIEHIENPMKFIEAALTLLKEDGLLIMTTPNKSFYPDSAIWSTDNPPVHYYWFSEDSFEYIASKLAVSASFTDFTDYYKTNEKVLIKSKSYDKFVSKRHLFDKDGNLLRKRNAYKPKWKRIYKALIANFKITILPLLSKNYYVSGKRTHALCVVLKKKQ